MKNIPVRRALSLILAFALVFSLCAAFPAAAEDTQPRSRTILLYLYGTNLETADGSASHNLKQIMRAPYNENIRFIVLTGSTEIWHMSANFLDGADEISTDILQVWEVEGRRENEDYGRMILLDAPEIEAIEENTMGVSETLKTFLDYGAANFPAEAYDLILWDHGGGPAFGACGINLPGLVRAFRECSLVQSGRRFELLDFDACLMCNAEIAAALAPYVTMLVGSAESEPGKGQEYCGWLTALHNDPDMTGFALGKEIVDSTIRFYEAISTNTDVTLSVIDLEKFSERMLPDLAELDRILIEEAKNPNERNHRYNFYDELYALENSIGYSCGEYCLYDLGNLLGALSVPQSESDILTGAQFEGMENAYTPAVMRLLTALRDETVVYVRNTDSFVRQASLGCTRDLAGNVIWPDGNGTFTVLPTGMNIFFGNILTLDASWYVINVSDTADLLPEGPTQTWLRNRTVAVSLYSLIQICGQTVSHLAEERGSTDFDYSDVRDAVSNRAKPEQTDLLLSHLLEMGVFADEDELTAFFSALVDQQIDEVVTKDKISAKRILEADGTSSSYQAVVTGSSAQAFMGLNFGVDVHSSCDASAAVRSYIVSTLSKWDWYTDYYFPDGIHVTLGKKEGELKIADYYDDFSDTDAEIYQRIYASPTSTWIIPSFEDEILALYDSEGNAHLVSPQYLDSSKNLAYFPLILWYPPTESEGEAFVTTYLYIAKSGDTWSIVGYSYEEDDGPGRTYEPMDDEELIGCRIAPGANLMDAFFGSYFVLPISTFIPIDPSLENWGLTFGYAKIDTIADVADYSYAYYVEDVYHTVIDITDLFLQADEAAENGEYARMLSGAELMIENPICNGRPRRPRVTVTLDGRELVPGEDFKVIYDGSSDPGDAYLAVMGIGDYIGTLLAQYTIREAGQAPYYSKPCILPYPIRLPRLPGLLFPSSL